MSKKATKSKRFKPTVEMMFKVYEGFATGQLITRMASEFDLSPQALRVYVKQFPTLAAAKKYGIRRKKKSQEGSNDLEDMVFGRLPPPLQKVWVKVLHEAKEGCDGPQGRKVQHMNMRERQILFIHAWIKFGFNTSRALKLLNIPRKTYQTWTEMKDFGVLLHALNETKKDMIEDSLLRLVRVMNPAATVFASKTMLRDRGYGERTEVVGKIEHSHNHQHDHALLNINIGELDLPLDVKMQVIDAMEKRKIEMTEDSQKRLNVIEGEFTNVN